MPLYSSDVHSKAMGQRDSEVVSYAATEEDVSVRDTCMSWCYLFVHHAKVDLMEKILSKRFKTFIHKTTIYKNENKHIREQERPTISGLIFVQGDKVKIQDFLNKYCHGTYLANDCSTKTTAVIPDKVMRPFMQLDMGRNRIRFMPHPLDYYSEGNVLVRITSGLLRGFEGYIIRISRDKCLVTSIGGVTVAIKGIYKESFENVGEYVRLRRMQQHIGDGCGMDVGGCRDGISKCFFSPDSQLDMMVMAQSLQQYVDRARGSLEKGRCGDAAEIALTLFAEVGVRYPSMSVAGKGCDVKVILDVCRDAGGLLASIAGDDGLPEDFRHEVDAEMRALAGKYPFLPIPV